MERREDFEQQHGQETGTGESDVNREDQGRSQESATGQTHSEIGAHGGGSPGADAAAAKREQTGENADPIREARTGYGRPD